MLDRFSGLIREYKELLAGVETADSGCDLRSRRNVDLGGVTARLLWFGDAHTKGDELIFVDPDRTLISGDVVQNKWCPPHRGDGGTPASWIAVVDKVATLTRARAARPQRAGRWVDGGRGEESADGNS